MSDQSLDELYEKLMLERKETIPLTPPWYGFLQELRWFRQRTRLTRFTFSLYPASPHYKRVKHDDIAYENREGKLHRTTGPAYISKNYKIEIWFYNDTVHREDGPAITFKDSVYYVKHGNFHRLDGPAIVEPNGPKRYFIDGVYYSPKQYKWEINRRKRRGLIK